MVFFLVQIVCMIFFFSDVKALHDFFSTALLLSYFDLVYWQEFFLKGELLAGIFFFFCNFPLQEFFLGNCHPLPPPPPVISNGPPLSSANIVQTQKRNASLPPIKSSLLITVERANVACQPDIYNKETAFVPTSTHFCLGGGG